MSRRRQREPAFDVVFFQPGVGNLLAREPLPSPGGAEVQVLRVARGLASRGWRVGLIVRGPRHDLPESVDGVRVLPIFDSAWGGRASGLTSRVVRIWRTLHRLAGTRSRVVVQRAAGRVTGLVAVISKAKGSRFVYSSANVHDFDFGAVERSRFSRAAYGIGIRLADRIIVQSAEQERMCRERFGRPAVAIKSIAQPAEPRRSSDALLWIGRLDGYKRPDAFVELARRCPDLPCWMIAMPGGPDSPAMGRWVRSAAADVPNLTLLPQRSHEEVGDLMGRAAAVVNTGRFEGMPNVFLEGWARGVPALASSHDPDGVIVREGLGAFAEGSDERLADLARELWERRFDQAELSARCRAHVAREHAPEPVLARWEQALELAGGSP